MKKLDYTSAPQIASYKSAECREYLRSVSSYSCTYCTISESEAPGATFHIDHFRPRANFPQYENTANNLRYSCPRCNLIKGKHWIKSTDGCIRNCEECKTNICHENIFRFVDSLTENPNDHLILQDDYKLEAINGSKPAIHTIKYLRLNRAQLIKLRRTRRFILLWKKELEERKESAEEKILFIKSEREKFERVLRSDVPNNDNQQLLDVITILFDMLSEQANYSKSIIENELEKVEKLLAIRSGADHLF